MDSVPQSHKQGKGDTCRLSHWLKPSEKRENTDKHSLSHNLKSGWNFYGLSFTGQRGIALDCAQQSLTPIYRTQPLKLFRKMFKLATIHFLVSKVTALPCDLPIVHNVSLFPLSSREQNILIHILIHCKPTFFFKPALWNPNTAVQSGVSCWLMLLRTQCLACARHVPLG